MRDRSPEERRALGRKGGLAAQAAGKRGPAWTQDQARQLGRLGGIARAAKARQQARLKGAK